MRYATIGSVLLVMASAWMPSRPASCPSVLIRGTVVEMIDRDAPPAETWPYRWGVQNHKMATWDEGCIRTAYLVLRDVEAVEPAGCDVPSRLLLRVDGRRGWRSRQDGTFCKSVGPFFSSRWHVGDRIYALVYRPGTGSVSRCCRMRCIPEGGESGAEMSGDRGPEEGGPTGSAGEQKESGAYSALNTQPEYKWICDRHLTELASALPQMCTEQENVILVLPLGRYVDPGFGDDEE